MNFPMGLLHFEVLHGDDRCGANYWQTSLRLERAELRPVCPHTKARALFPPPSPGSIFCCSQIMAIYFFKVQKPYSNHCEGTNKFTAQAAFLPRRRDRKVNSQHFSLGFAPTLLLELGSSYGTSFGESFSILAYLYWKMPLP